MITDASRYQVRLAETPDDIAAAQRLRYEVFVEEMGAAASPAEQAVRREMDRFDPYFEHLLLIDTRAGDAVVGVYRLMRGSRARAGTGFYGATEYDLSKLESLECETLELGRSCIAKEARGGVGLHLLWDALGAYVLRHDIRVLFGVASFHGTDPRPLAEPLSYLHHTALAPPELRVTARPQSCAPMDSLTMEQIDKTRALKAIPSLIKAYLRLGGFVGEGAFIDRAFNTIDVCLIMDTEKMVGKYRAFYARDRGK